MLFACCIARLARRLLVLPGLARLVVLFHPLPQGFKHGLQLQAVVALALLLLRLALLPLPILLFK
ncbi:hypothetical protein D3C81_2289190 [compost metagenome]